MPPTPSEPSSMPSPRNVIRSGSRSRRDPSAATTASARIAPASKMPFSSKVAAGGTPPIVPALGLRAGSGDRGRERSGDERRHDLGELVAELALEQAPVGVEMAVRVAEGEVALDDTRAGRAEHLAQLGLRPYRAEGAGARPDDGDRLVAEHVRRDRARGPVERVLQLAGDRRVV